MHSVFNSHQWLSRPRRIAGIMSGTSMDGFDAAIAEFSLVDGNIVMKFITGQSCDIEPDLYAKLQRCVSEDITVADLSDLNVLLSHCYAQVFDKACRYASFASGDVDAIGLHGQTLWHAPRPHAFCGQSISSTLQLGSITTLSQLTQCTTVGDFRSADIALGGQGAPLVPIFDYEFLTDDARDVVALNIGGMSNVTLLPKKVQPSEVRAFDTGPGNVWIDSLMQKFYQKKFDDNGMIARSGNLSAQLLEKLQKIEYIFEAPPKSTGRELFSAQYISEILRSCSPDLASSDIIHTLSYFTAWSIAESLRRFSSDSVRLIVSGGGVNNSFLLESLKTELPQAEIIPSDEVGVPSKWKECLCFAFLAYRTLAAMVSNMSSVTGAATETVLGSVAPIFPMRHLH